MVAGAVALVASAAWAAEGTVSMGSGTAEPGEQVSIELNSEGVTEPGLGAWSIDVTYDPSVVTPVRCETEHGAVCNLHYGDNMIRTAGATAIGIEGDTLLATLTFECADDEGHSAITVSLPDFADATLGGPLQIDAEVNHGEVECVEGGAAAATATLAPQVPTTGMGGGSTDGSDITLLLATLIGVGAVALTGFGVLRTRSQS
jgi:hypothetical protein